MDFEKLVSNLQEEQNRLESQVLPYCNPQEIAQKIMNDLEAASPLEQDRVVDSSGYGYPAKAGSLFACYELWFIKEPEPDFPLGSGAKGVIRGPLSKCSDRYKLSQVVLDLVKKYINDDLVQLVLEPGEIAGYCSGMILIAGISREDVEYLKRMTPAERAERSKKTRQSR
ncbi:MAG: hypothetical protein LBB72_07745 [Spirochaetaceae bacterium]|nr:hypothetical protein [Spirochaetaceae bacterium]